MSLKTETEFRNQPSNSVFWRHNIELQLLLCTSFVFLISPFCLSVCDLLHYYTSLSLCYFYFLFLSLTFCSSLPHSLLPLSKCCPVSRNVICRVVFSYKDLHQIQVRQGHILSSAQLCSTFQAFSLSGRRFCLFLYCGGSGTKSLWTQSCLTAAVSAD